MARHLLFPFVFGLFICIHAAPGFGGGSDWSGGGVFVKGGFAGGGFEGGGSGFGNGHGGAGGLDSGEVGGDGLAGDNGGNLGLGSWGGLDGQYDGDVLDINNGGVGLDGANGLSAAGDGYNDGDELDFGELENEGGSYGGHRYARFSTRGSASASSSSSASAGGGHGASSSASSSASASGSSSAVASASASASSSGR
ncbi:unnamed protein product, partial [Iphiclides podalirius]